MAALNCPECNGLVGHGVRKCPHCGFDICKAAVDKYSIELQATKNERIAKYSEQLKSDLEKEIEQINNWYDENETKYSQKPSIFKTEFVKKYHILLCIIFIAFVSLIVMNLITPDDFTTILTVLCFIAILFSALKNYQHYKSEMDSYEYWHYKKQETVRNEKINEVIERYHMKAYSKATNEILRLKNLYEEENFDKPTPPVRQSKINDNQNQKINTPSENQHASNICIPKCPICGSTDLVRIDTSKKVLKVIAFGLYGAGDIGKTWRCNNCKSKF